MSRFCRRRRDITELMELLFGNSQKTINSCTHTKAREVFLYKETRNNAAGYYIL